MEPRVGYHEFDTPSATVQQAADTIDIIPERIAKTLSFRGKEDKAILVGAAGDAKVDNKVKLYSVGFSSPPLNIS